MFKTPTQIHSTNTLFAAMVFAFVVLSIGCSNSSQFPTKTTDNTNQSSGSEDPGVGAEPTTPTEPPQPSPPPTTPSYKMVPLSWESAQYPERTKWSQHLQKIILDDWNTLLPGSDDITNFCPRYNSLDNNERANVWAQLFAAVSKYESAYNPASRMQETTMGTDPITRKPVFSEGLLQLSYQDSQWAPWCKFDWSKDKSLSPTDPKKTILNPYLNLDCGVGIMAKQIKTKGNIVIGSGVYWAVLKSGGSYNKVSSIQSIVRSLSICK